MAVFAYGATGAGKTFSMLGSPQTPGVIFLSMMDLYNIKESEKDERKIDVTVSYLEVQLTTPSLLEYIILHSVFRNSLPIFESIYLPFIYIYPL